MMQIGGKTKSKEIGKESEAGASKNYFGS